MAELVDDVHDCMDVGARATQEQLPRKYKCREEHDCMDAGGRVAQEQLPRMFVSDRAAGAL